MSEKFVGVYIMGNDRPTLYTGVTNNLIRRVLEHKLGKIKGFTQRYNLKALLYYEVCDSMTQAIIREKQIKDLDRKDKLTLIKKANPMLVDVSQELLCLVEDLSSVVVFEG